MIRIRTPVLAALVTAGIFGGILVAKAVGYWETTSTKQPVSIKTGEFAGMPDPADIRGSYTWMDLERVFSVPAEEAAKAFSTPGQTFMPEDRVSLLEEAYLAILPEGYEVGTGSVRLFAALYSGLPLEAEEGTLLPPGAIDLLISTGKSTAETLQAHAFTAELMQAFVGSGESKPDNTTSTASATQPETATKQETGTTASTADTTVETHTPAPTGSGEGSGSTARTIAGKTTFYDLYQWGLSKEQVRNILGYEPGADSQVIRDSAAAAGKEFSEIKTALQALVDTSAP